MSQKHAIHIFGSTVTSLPPQFLQSGILQCLCVKRGVCVCTWWTARAWRSARACLNIQLHIKHHSRHRESSRLCWEPNDHTKNIFLIPLGQLPLQDWRIKVIQQCQHRSSTELAYLSSVIPYACMTVHPKRFTHASARSCPSGAAAENTVLKEQCKINN
jgi:hypothetical protein